MSQPCFGHARPLRAAVYQHVSWSSPGSAPAGARQRWLGPPHRPASPARRLSCPSRGGEAACRQPGHTSLLAPLIPRRLHLSDRRPRHPPPLPRLSSAPMSLAPPNPVALARRLPPPARRLHREAVATGQAILVQMAQHRGSAHQQGRIARARGEAAPGARQRERVVRRTRRLFTTTRHENGGPPLQQPICLLLRRATADIHLAPGDTWVDTPQQRAPVNSSEWRATADIHIGTARAGGTEGMGWLDRPQERAPVNASTWRTTADIHIATGDGWVEAAESPVSPTKSTTWRRTNDLHITRGSLVEARGPPRRRAEHVVAVPHLRCSASTLARHESGPRPCLHTGERGPHRVRRQQERVAHHERPPPGDGRPGRLRRGEWASEPGEGQRLEAGE